MKNIYTIFDFRILDEIGVKNVYKKKKDGLSISDRPSSDYNYIKNNFSSPWLYGHAFPSLISIQAFLAFFVLNVRK